MGWRESIAKVLAGKVGGPWEGGIRAYHSSPHDFDKVDFSKLLTGEGANVYGAGHYMAENPAVSGQGGQYWQSFLHRFEGTPEGAAASRLRAQQFDREHAINSTRRDYNDWKGGEVATSDPAYAAKMLKLREEELRLLEGGGPVGPRTYEMNLRARPEELLDWDKAYGQQYPDVQKRLMSVSPSFGLGGDRPIGVFAAEPLKNPATAEKLANAGIPGIRYLDEGSRNKFWTDAAKARGEFPTYNYVGTDPSKLDILAKYGIAGAGPTLGAFTAQDKYEEAR